MRFTPEFLDEIKTRLSVSEVVGKRVRLKRAGREWSGLSPFNAEKTPSFFVNDAKMAWFDFSSQRNGNIFDFLMATEGMSFPEAVERLAAEAGLDMPRRTAEDSAREQRRAGLWEILEWAAASFASNLAGRAGARGRDYLSKRELGAESRRTFGLGLALPERFALRDHLAAKGASAEAMIEAGLLVHGEGIAVPYDRFRDRVMFPIADRSGRVIAFGGRALDATAPAKYLNSPETPLFHKGGVLYNHHRARKAAADRGTVIAVEGYVDVIAMSGAGFPNVVAPLGTALTIEQCELMWRMAPEPILCFDGDGAGRRAAFRAVDTVLPALGPNRTLRFAFLPEGQDPDDLARSGGEQAIADVLAKARPLVDVLWARETEGVVLDTPERRAGLEQRLGDLVRGIGDEALRRYYGSEMRARLAAIGAAAPGKRRSRPAVAVARPGNRGRFEPPPPRGYRGSAPPPLSESLARTAVLTPMSFARRDVEILVLVLNHPGLLDKHAEDLAHLDVAQAELAAFRDLVVTLGADVHGGHDAFKSAIDAAGKGDVRRRIEAAAARLPHWCMAPAAAEADAEHMLKQAVALHRKTRELHKQLDTARKAFADDGSEGNFAQICTLQAELHAVDGTEAIVEGYGSLSGHVAEGG